MSSHLFLLSLLFLFLREQTDIGKPACRPQALFPLPYGNQPTVCGPQIPQLPKLSAAALACSALSDFSPYSSFIEMADQSTEEPSRAPCGACDRSVLWTDKGVACESCGVWFHATCQYIGSHTYYNDLDDSDVTWHCVICGNQNHSTVAFDLYGISQEDKTGSSTLSVPDSNCGFKPLHSSTPTRTSDRKRKENRPLRLLNVNFRSVVGKRAEIANLVDSTKPDIVIGTETWLDQTISNSEFFPPQFRIYRKDRSRAGGGVLIAVREDLQSTTVPELDTNCEMVWIKLFTRNQRHIHICAFYRPHVSDAAALQELETSLHRASSIRNAEILVAGDFNLPGWDWASMTLKRDAPSPALHEKFVDTINDTGLEQIVQEPTRLSNVLDLVLTNSPTLVPRVETIPGLSDHDIVFFEYNVKPDSRKNAVRPIPLYRKANWDQMRRDLQELESSYKDSGDQTTEELWHDFKSTLRNSMDNNIPTKTPKKRDSYPWITPEIRKLIRRRDRKYREQKKRGTEELKQEVKKLQRELQKQLRRSYWRYVGGLFEEEEAETDSRPNLKRFWTYMKHQRSGTVGIPPLKAQGRLITDPKLKAEALNSQFNKAFSDGRTYTAEEFAAKCTMPDKAEDYPPMAEITVTARGIEKLLAKMNPSKAAGPDGIPPRVLRELASEAAPLLARIYNSSLASGVVPADWKEATVAPVYKKGEQYDPANYRPISLTSIPCKVFEHVLVSAIMDHLEDSDILVPQQHGFRKSRSCETQLLEFIEEVSTAMENGTSTDVIIMDFAKAFDKVNHSLLTHKLNHYGIRGSINCWIQNFLSDRKQAVVVDGATSDYIAVKSGVPQGSVLGPCLFLAYINDLPPRVSSLTRLFADDTMLYRLILCAQDRTVLQDDLKRLEEWEAEWDMSFHPDKCNLLPLTRSRDPTSHDYTLHGHTLSTVSSAKYLGVTIQSNASWDKHIDTTCAKANRVLGMLRRNLRISSAQIKETAYKAMVRPILEYASCVWDPHTAKDIRKLEKIQRRAARFTLNRHRNTSSVDEMLTELDWPSLQQRRS